MALRVTRVPVNRPSDFSERLRTTFEALRFVRIKDNGQIVLLRVVSDLTTPDERPIYPSLAALQIYLLNDQQFKAEYVQRPLRFIAGRQVDVRQSIDGIRTMVRSLRNISQALGDLDRNDTNAAMRAVPLMLENYPDIYYVLRSAVLLRLDALRDTVLTRYLLDYIFDEVWRRQSPPILLRQMSALQREFMLWRSQATTIGTSRLASEETVDRLALSVVETLLPPLLDAARKNANVAAARTPDDPVVPRAPEVVVRPKPEPVFDEFSIKPEPVDILSGPPDVESELPEELLTGPLTELPPPEEDVEFDDEPDE